jgi:cytoskeleton protein RodZ
MSGLGEQIASAREQRGMTAADAARRLHMRTDFIQAIEAEDWPRLGPPIYARGFVRNYARMVGIDPSSIVEQLDAVIPSRDPETHIEPLAGATNGELQTEPVPINVRLQHAQEPRAAWYPWLLGAMSSLAAVLVLAVLYYTFGPTQRDQGSVAQNQTSQAQQPAAATPAPQDDAIFNGANAGSANAEQRSGVNLQLQLTQDSWLSVTVDGKRVVYETLPAGTVRDFHGVREITLRAGNAGGVNATIDGRPLGSLGQHGQVEERSFAAKAATPSTGPRE